MGGVAIDVDTGGVKAPDGGWGWAVLAGCFVITGFSYAFPKAVSVFFKELIREFGVEYKEITWVSSILLAMLYGTGRLLLRQCIQCDTPRVAEHKNQMRSSIQPYRKH